jgi:hypothetical protein
MAGMESVALSSEDEVGLLAKFAAWAATLSERERVHLWDALVAAAGATGDDISGYTSPAQIAAARATAKQRLDSLSEMGETESLRMQMMMDRRSKFLTTMSNILGNVAETQSTITRNIR